MLEAPVPRCKEGGLEGHPRAALEGTLEGNLEGSRKDTPEKAACRCLLDCLLERLGGDLPTAFLWLAGAF